jgi:hypothetical protein
MKYSKIRLKKGELGGIKKTIPVNADICGILYKSGFGKTHDNPALQTNCARVCGTGACAITQKYWFGIHIGTTCQSRGLSA